MRFKLEWFNPLRNPFRLWRELMQQLKWQHEYERLNPEYTKESDKLQSAGVGLLIQILLIWIIILIGASLN